MKPIEFEGQNVTFAKDQPQYIPLPAHRSPSGVVTSCWKFSWHERIWVLLGARLYWDQHTFGDPLQPQRPDVRYVFETKADGPRWKLGVFIGRRTALDGHKIWSWIERVFHPIIG